MREYIAFNHEYVNQSSILDEVFIKDYHSSNRFPIERTSDKIIIMCPSDRCKRWYINPDQICIYGKIVTEIEPHELIDEGLFEI